ncbi:MAG: ABC transporter permease, partial [Brevibacillus sp.]
MQLRRTNWSLRIGAILVAFLVVLGFIGPYIAPYELNFQEVFRSETVNGKSVYLSPPIPPSAEHWLGTDNWGYDLLTLLLHGAPYTIFVTLAVALLRVLLGTLVGLYIGIQDKPQRWWLSVENAWSYIPLFIPVYFFLRGVSINSELSVSTLVALFIGAASVLGVPSVASSIRQKTEQIKETQFVLAAVSMGAGRGQIMFRHVLPHIKEQVVVIMATETVAVMTLMGLMGMFNLFIGGTKMSYDPVLYQSITHEWAGLLGSYRTFVYSKNAWLFLIPLICFVFAVGSFSLLAKGL